MTVDDTATNYQYNNEPINFKVKGGSSYTVAFGSITDFKTPDSITKTAVAGYTNAIKAEYQAGIVTVNITGASNGSATVSGYATGTATNGSTYQVPYGQTIKFTPKQVKPYTTPSDQTITVSNASHTVSLEYKSVVLTMNFVGLIDASSGSATVSASGMDTATVSHNETVRVPYNTAVTITPNTLDGYNSPSTINQSYTSNTTVTLTWEELVGGIFIYTNEGKFYTRAEWNTANNSKVVGIAVIAPPCPGFVISLYQPTETECWYVDTSGEGSSSHPAVDEMNGYPETFEDAITYYHGADDNITLIFCNEYDLKYYAYSCTLTRGDDSNYSYDRNISDFWKGTGYTYVKNNNWDVYIGSSGEWYAVGQNLDEINACLNLVNGDPFYSDAWAIYWTSTLSGNAAAKYPYSFDVSRSFNEDFIGTSSHSGRDWYMRAFAQPYGGLNM